MSDCRGATRLQLCLCLWLGFSFGFGFGFSQLNFAQKETLSPIGLRVSGKAPGDDLLSHGLSHTTIGAAAFHFR
ncbi:hypothetical protein, partial [Xanthomonas arboricola]|uniref:hypothetical protein n=1 Tax=Xanthomonas arboricola TaxID=56448 RepID=UPI001C8717E8